MHRLVRRFLSGLLTLGLLSFLAAGCASASIADTTQATAAPELAQAPQTALADSSTMARVPLRLGVIASVDAVPLVIAQERGFFAAQGLDVQLESFKNAKDRDAAIQAGSLDGAIADQVAAVLFQNALFDWRIVTRTTCDFVLVAGKDSGISGWDDLAGHSVALSEKTVIDLTLDQLLLAHNLLPEAVERPAIPAIPARLEMLRNNQVDAALLPEPFASLAVQDGAIRLGSAQDVDLNPTVFLFAGTMIDENPQTVQAFLAALQQAIEYTNQTPVRDIEDLVIETVGFPPSMQGSIALPVYADVALPDPEALQAVLDWATAKGMTRRNLTPADLCATLS